MFYLKKIINKLSKFEIIKKIYFWLKFHFYFDPRKNYVPNPFINYNQSIENFDTAVYIDTFLNKGKTQFEFLQSLTDKVPHILDFGCGFSPMGAYLNLVGEKHIKYHGIEPHHKAFRWTSAKLTNSNFLNYTHLGLPEEQNYLTQNFTKNRSASNLQDLQIPFSPNIIFSSSVFTHMFPETALNTLQKLNNLGTSTTIFVNTWLILDQIAQQNLDNGLADRKLNLYINGIYTYDKLNPLVCTAYLEEDILEIYSQSNQKIIKILHGEWSGDGRWNPLTYQDVIISAKIK